MLADQQTSSSPQSLNNSGASSPSQHHGRPRRLTPLLNHFLQLSASSSAVTAQGMNGVSASHDRRPRRSHTAPASDVTDSIVASAEHILSRSETGEQFPRVERRAQRTRMLPIVNSNVFHESRHPALAPSNESPSSSSSLQVQPSLPRPDTAPPSLNAHLPSIQFIPAADPTRARPSLDFRRITRVLPHNDAVIKVGRYSERDSASDANLSMPSDAPIGFKSKVVSRRHCEFSYVNNQWFVKDVKSSSGTFLNHIRLSQPGMESKLYPVNDGDTIQLGIDFKGGEEMIFRCVKIRIETNRGWQRGLNKFNRSTHKRLQALARGRSETDNEESSKQSTDCTICLNSIQPCQALFVAPCSHTWHYKCIRKILDEAISSEFLCPNCRAHADLDAEIEDAELADFEDDFDEDMFDDAEEAHENDPDIEGELASGAGNEAIRGVGSSAQHPALSASALGASIASANEAPWNPLSDMTNRRADAPVASLDDTLDVYGRSRAPNDGTAQAKGAESFATPAHASSSSRHGIPSLGLGAGFTLSPPRGRTNTTLTATSELSDTPSEVGSMGASGGLGPSSLEGLVRDGPMTPRNNAGPFVFDGAAAGSAGGRSSGGGGGGGGARLSGVSEEEQRRHDM